MSPNVGNFVHDLVEMAKAMETLPQVEAERDRLNASLNETLVVVQNREVSIIELKAQIETLQAKVRETEASRDDAELRFLEADENAVKVSAVLKSVASMATASWDLLNPPKPQPMPEPEAQPPVPAVPVTGQDIPAWAGPEQTLAATDTAIPWGQGEVNPTSVTTSDNSNSKTEATGASASLVESKLTEAGPYANKRYYDHPTYVPLSQWLEGGGTEEDYNWHPNYSNQTRA